MPLCIEKLYIIVDGFVSRDMPQQMLFVLLTVICFYALRVIVHALLMSWLSLSDIQSALGLRLTDCTAEQALRFGIFRRPLILRI